MYAHGILQFVMASYIYIYVGKVCIQLNNNLMSKYPILLFLLLRVTFVS